MGCADHPICAYEFRATRTVSVDPLMPHLQSFVEAYGRWFLCDLHSEEELGQFGACGRTI